MLGFPSSPQNHISIHFYLLILRIPATLEDIANAKKNLRRQAFSVENIDTNYENCTKIEDYQNIIFTHKHLDKKPKEMVDYQNVDFHTYQNIHKNKPTKDSTTIVHSHHNDSNNKSSFTELEGLRNININRNAIEDDGLYELYNSKNIFHEDRSYNSLNPTKLRVQAKKIYLDSSDNTVLEKKSKLCSLIKGDPC